MLFHTTTSDLMFLQELRCDAPRSSLDDFIDVATMSDHVIALILRTDSLTLQLMGELVIGNWK